MTTAFPPTIPGSLDLATMSVDTAKIETLIGDVIYKINTWKPSVKVATTGAVTLSGTTSSPIDGVAIVAGDRVLVKNEGDATNGIYVVKSDAWERAQDFDTGAQVAGAAIYVNEGTTNGDKVFYVTNNSGSDVVGTNTLVFVSTMNVTNLDVSGTATVANLVVTDSAEVGTAATSTVGFYGATAVVQQSTGGVTAGFTQVGVATVAVESTFTGNVGTAAYTIGDIVAALKNLGLIER